ncbi:MAG: SprT family zinc-dependent metalloprotease [Defluviicoccus sp.]|nr:SprT family zinc-dependent metalloprotease [Defluviicoccus sp.]MDE0386113.1 SprT family zinc-dependent metalloprotease [Defluviicoccus sp.]
MSARLRLADGRALDVAIRRSARARRIQIKIAPVGGAVELVLPPGAEREEGLAFLEAKREWVAARTARARPRVPFADGAALPFLGGTLTVRCADAGRPAAWREGDTLRVSGRPEDLPGRVESWLRGAARAEIAPRVRDKAVRLGARPGRIAVRDTTSRWGSCSAAGNLSFCWRIAMAPVPVLDYVVAHEVAHLAEPNHGARFWAHVGRLCDDPQSARAWLRHNGAVLHRYG